jgi:hypothetical protein
VRGPGLRMKSATMTVPSGLHSRASCCTNLLQVGKGGGRRGGEGGARGADVRRGRKQGGQSAWLGMGIPCSCFAKASDEYLGETYGFGL